MECQVEEKMVDNSMVSIPGILSLFLRCGLLFKVQEPNVILNVTSPIFVMNDKHGYILHNSWYLKDKKDDLLDMNKLCTKINSVVAHSFISCFSFLLKWWLPTMTQRQL